jgi:hypothetical protein
MMLKSRKAAAPGYLGWRNKIAQKSALARVLTEPEGIERMREPTGFGILVALQQFGILSDALTRRNMDVFAAEVMPHLRD